MAEQAQWRGLAQSITTISNYVRRQRWRVRPSPQRTQGSLPPGHAGYRSGYTYGTMGPWDPGFRRHPHDFVDCGPEPRPQDTDAKLLTIYLLGLTRRSAYCDRAAVRSGLLQLLPPQRGGDDLQGPATPSRQRYPLDEVEVRAVLGLGVHSASCRLMERRCDAATHGRPTWA